MMAETDGPITILQKKVEELEKRLDDIGDGMEEYKAKICALQRLGDAILQGYQTDVDTCLDKHRVAMLAWRSND